MGGPPLEKDTNQEMTPNVCVCYEKKRKNSTDSVGVLVSGEKRFRRERKNNESGIIRRRQEESETGGGNRYVSYTETIRKN